MPDTPMVAVRDLTFAHSGAASPLFVDLSVHLSVGFTGVIGANGSGKTTLLDLLDGRLKPTSGRVERGGRVVYCEQRTDCPPRDLDRFLEDWSSDAARLRSRLAVEFDFGLRWRTLSHGERKRAQIGTALWRKPNLLLIDEPTNHLDADAAALLSDALATFPGVGVIVSHDRALLDTLCSQCIWIEPPNATLYAGGYTRSNAQRDADRGNAVAERENAERAHRALARAMAERREKASREHSQRSKRHLHRNDADGREKIDRARIADGKAGAALRQLEGRTSQAAKRLEAAAVEKTYRTGISLPGARARSDLILGLHAGRLDLGGGRSLHHPALTVRPADRIAIVGPNGSGKSTLVRHVLEKTRSPADRLIYMPQEIPADAAGPLLDAARRLPPEALGRAMTIVSRLGSRPKRLLETSEPSPGEVRKLLIALGMARAPELLVLDEPTNHLDLPSIQALEGALADCPCALLLVSHDRAFLQRLANVTWRLEPNADRNSELQVV